MSKQTSIIKTLINRSFKANKTRNFVAVFAITLTTLMFTSLFVLSQSITKNLQDMNFQQVGHNNHLSFSLVTEEEAEKIISHKAVCNWGKTTVIGLAENEELFGRQVEIRYADENFATSSFAMPSVGRLPQEKDEIALDMLTLDKLGLPYELNQTITLKWRKDMNSSSYTTNTFTLVEYWEGNSVAMASMAWISEAFVQEVCGSISQEAQRQKNQVFGLSQLHVDLYNDRNLEQMGEQILSDVDLTHISFSPNIGYDVLVKQNIMKEVFPMIICMLLVFVSGYLIIYNVFQISVAADIQFYGKLKTLGTSKRQLKKMIYGQANRLSVIGIPIGLLLGYFLGSILVPLMITGLSTKPNVAVNPYIFIGSAVFAWLTVLISCMRPAKIAGKVSPMEALRYNDSDNSEKRKIKKTNNGAKLSKMALSNLGRNKKRTITVICSLTLGLVLLTGINAKNASFDIDKYMSHMVISDFEVKDSSIATLFDTYNPYGTTISNNLVSQINDLQGLENKGQLYSQVVHHKISSSTLANIKNYYNEERISYIKETDPALANSHYDMIESSECDSILYGIDGLILDTFSQDYRIIDGSFNKEKFLSGNYCLAEATSGTEKGNKEIQPTYSVGDVVELNGKQYEVMSIVTNISAVTEGENGKNTFLSFYLPTDAFQKIYPNNTLRKIFFDVDDNFQMQAEEMLINY